MFTYVIVVVENKIQPTESCELSTVVITVYGSCRLGGCIRFPEGDDVSKHVAVLTTYKMLLIYMLCICWSG
jgi:hypothetical protein